MRHVTVLRLKKYIVGQPLSAGGMERSKEPHAYTTVDGEAMARCCWVMYVARKKDMAAGASSGEGCGGSLSMLGH